MKTYSLCLLGFGNVGRAFGELLLRKRDELRTEHGLEWRVTGIATGRHGAAIDPGGIPVERAVELARAGGSLASLTRLAAPEDKLEFIRACPADVLVENTPVNAQTGEPALSHIRAAIRRGMHAITANKGPVVHGYPELSALADSLGKRFLFESTVMDGAPIFSLFRAALPAAKVLGFRGILNSTTNFILTEMEAGRSFDDAVRQAQAIGIAETDPSADVDGWDAAVKVCALASVLMGVPLKPADVRPEGIRGLSSAEVRRARAEGRPWKLVCTAERAEAGVLARVRPEQLDLSDPLSAVAGTSSAIQFRTDTLKQLTVTETDPGPEQTAYGLLADLINLHRGT